MGSIVLVAIGIVAAGLVVRAGLGIARFYDRSFHDRRAAADDFYKVAEEVVSHPHAAPDDIELIETMNSLINEPRTLIALLEVWQKQNKNPPVGQVFDTSKELTGLLVLAYDRWFAAITARKPLLGAFVRIYRAQQSVPSTVNGAAKRVQRQTHHRLAHA
jgi:hypothetical protein